MASTYSDGVFGRIPLDVRHRIHNVFIAIAKLPIFQHYKLDVGALHASADGQESEAQRATFKARYSKTHDPVQRLLFVGIALLLRNLWVWVHWHYLATPRRGGRQLNLHILPFQTLLWWLAHEFPNPDYAYIALEAVIKTVCGTDVAVELTGMYSPRVLITASRAIIPSRYFWNVCGVYPKKAR